jgi:hypothetical protein
MTVMILVNLALLGLATIYLVMTAPKTRQS